MPKEIEHLAELATHENSIDFSGIAGILPNPDPVLKAMNKDMKVYRDLLVDNHVMAVESSRKAGVESLLWEIDRGKSKSRAAKFVESLFEDLPVDSMISQMLEAADFGYQPMEVVWGRSGSFDLPLRVEAKPPEWFCFNDKAQLMLRTRANWLGEAVGEYKFIVPKHRANYQNPYGRPLLGSAFWGVFFKKAILKMGLTFAEKYGMPFIVGKLPKGTDAPAIAKMKESLKNMIRDAVAILDTEGSVEIIEAAGKGASADLYLGIASFWNAEISKGYLGQTLTTEIGATGGAYAAANTHFQVRGELVRRDQKMVEAAMNQLIRWVVELNFGTATALPRFTMFHEADIDKDLAERDGKLQQMGVRFTKVYFEREYNLEEDEFELTEPIPAATGALPFAAPPAQVAQTPVEKATEAISADALQKAADPLMAPVLKIIAEAKSLDAIGPALAFAYPDMDDDAFQTLLARAIFAAETYGRLTAGKNKDA